MSPEHVSGDPGSASLDHRRLFTWVAILILVGFFASSSGRNEGTWRVLADPPLYANTAERMRSDGVDYYQAMADELVSWLGHSASDTRAYRTPTVFLVWRWLPDDRAIWLMLVGFVAATGVALSSISRSSSLVPLIVVGYSLAAAFNVFTVTELWSAMAALLALVAWRRQRDWLAAGLVLLAVAIRETAGGLLLGGIAAAWATKRPLRPWLVALGVAVAAYVVHVRMATPHLRPEGKQAALLGTGGLQEFVAMISVGLPLRWILGPALYALALWRVFGSAGERWLFGPHLLFPVLGLFIGRPYWGFLVVPLILVFAAEKIEELARGLGRARAPDPVAA